MTEPRRRSAWHALADAWSDDDPAIRRMREALQGPATAPEPPGRPEPAPVVSESAPAPVPAPVESRRDRIALLVERVRRGDLSAVDALRRLLDG